MHKALDRAKIVDVLAHNSLDKYDGSERIKLRGLNEDSHQI